MSTEAALFSTAPWAGEIFHNYESGHLEELLNANVWLAQAPDIHPCSLLYSKPTVQRGMGVEQMGSQRKGNTRARPHSGDRCNFSLRAALPTLLWRGPQGSSGCKGTLHCTESMRQHQTQTEDRGSKKSPPTLSQFIFISFPSDPASYLVPFHLLWQLAGTTLGRRIQV